MNFDITTFIAAAKAMLLTQLGTTYTSVKTITDKFFVEKEAALKQLVADETAGEFDAIFFADRLKDEASILESELAALSDISKVKAAGIANTFATFFLNTVLNFLPKP